MAFLHLRTIVPSAHRISAKPENPIHKILQGGFASTGDVPGRSGLLHLLPHLLFTGRNFPGAGPFLHIQFFCGILCLVRRNVSGAYHALPSKRAKLVLLATSLFITSGTSLLSSFHVQGISINLFSDYWQACYPITYYFIGAYIREYQPKINKLLNTALLIFAVAAEAWVSKQIFMKNNHGLFDWNTFGGYGCIFTIVIAVLFFLLFYQVDFKNRPVRFLVRELSVHSFDIYLFSFFFDKLIYPWFLERYYQSQQQFLLWGIAVVPLVIFCSYLVSKVKCLLFDGVKAVSRSALRLIGGSLK